MSHFLTSASSSFTASAGHRGRCRWLTIAISACTLIALANAKADSILSVDFDVNSGYYNFGYAFGFYGDAGFGYHGVEVTQESGLFPGIGVGGSNALRITADSSAMPAQLPPDRTYEGWTFVIVQDAGLPTLTSPTLSDYTFSLSGRAEGQTGGGNQTAQMDISIFAPDGTIGAMDGNRDTLITLRFANGIALGSAFQDSTMNFGSFSSIEGGSIADFAAFFPAANEIVFTAAANDSVNAFGYDAGNAIVLDNMNLAVSSVPEPASATMFILGALGLTMRGRRRKGGVGEISRLARPARPRYSLPLPGHAERKSNGLSKRFHPLLSPGIRSFRTATAFTLMELLIVMAIIGVLVAIAVPVFTSVKRSGLQAQSISRLRDLQRANIQYAGEHNQFYVPVWDMDPDVNQPWFLNPDLLRYLGANPSGCWWGHSPANVHSPLVPLNVSQGMGVSYGINSDSLGWPPVPRQMIRDVPFPSRMLAFAESQDWHVNEWGSNGRYQVPEAYSGATVAYRYNKMTNAAFFDGHVETLPQSQVKGNLMLWRGQE